MRREYSAYRELSATSDQEARKEQSPGTLSLCTNSSHPYQNKGFADQNSEFLSPLFSHRCAHLSLQTFCFDTLHKNTRGEGWLWSESYQRPAISDQEAREKQFVPESGGGKVPNPKREERFLAARTPLGMTKREGDEITDFGSFCFLGVLVCRT